VITAAASPLETAGPGEVRFIVQDATAPSKEALVNCLFPLTGAGAIRALCTVTQTAV